MLANLNDPLVHSAVLLGLQLAGARGAAEPA